MSVKIFGNKRYIWEMGAEWYGDTDGAFFKFDDINQRRKINNAFYPLEIYRNYQIKYKHIILFVLIIHCFHEVFQL